MVQPGRNLAAVRDWPAEKGQMEHDLLGSGGTRLVRGRDDNIVVAGGKVRPAGAVQGMILVGVYELGYHLHPLLCLVMCIFVPGPAGLFALGHSI